MPSISESCGWHRNEATMVSSNRFGGRFNVVDRVEAWGES